MSKRKFSLLFSLSFGPDHGIGNLLRCLVLSRTLKDSAEIFFLLPDSISVEAYGWDSKFKRVSMQGISEVLPKCDVLVFDHQGPVNAEFAFRQFRAIWPDTAIIALDYFHLQDENVSAFVNLSEHRETEPKTSTDASLYVGLKYAIIRPAFEKYRGPGKNRETVSEILITFGGEDISGWTLTAIRWIEQHVRPAARVTVILGPLNTRCEEIKQFLRGRVCHEYVVIGHVTDIEGYMARCDVAFCGGGTTVLELAYLGIPVVALPQHEMERKFLNYFERNNFIAEGAEESIKEIEAEPCVRYFRDPGFRRNVSRIGKRIVDGKGAERIARIILNMAKLKEEKSFSETNKG